MFRRRAAQEVPRWLRCEGGHRLSPPRRAKDTLYRCDVCQARLGARAAHACPKCKYIVCKKCVQGKRLRGIKLILGTGDATVGKTSLSIRTAMDKVSEMYIPTVHDNYCGHVRGADGAVSLVTLWDCAGGEDFGRYRPLMYPNTDVFLVCFAVNRVASFENVRTKWVPEIKKHQPNTPFILVGCKTDRRKEKPFRRISFVAEDRGFELAKELGAATLEGPPPILTSAGHPTSITGYHHQFGEYEIPPMRCLDAPDAADTVRAIEAGAAAARRGVFLFVSAARAAASRRRAGGDQQPGVVGGTPPAYTQFGTALLRRVGSFVLPLSGAERKSLLDARARTAGYSSFRPRWGEPCYLECSARTGQNVGLVLRCAVAVVRQARARAAAGNGEGKEGQRCNVQ